MLKTNTVKRISAFFLALMMILGTLPLNVFAEGLQGKTASPIVIDSNAINKKDSADEEDSTTGSKTHTISFNPNGGSGKMKPVEVADGKNYTLPKNEFKAPEGKKFKSWTFEEDEQEEGYILTVTRDLELKANWEDAKTNPIKKALNSILGKEEEKAKDADQPKLEVSDNLEKSKVGAGNNNNLGPSNNAVASSDGKAQIRNFEAFWTSVDGDTIVDNRTASYSSTNSAWLKSNFEKKPSLQINWGVSNESPVKKGDFTVNIPNPRFNNDKELIYGMKEYSIPQAKYTSGKIDYDADYGNATFAYYYDKENSVIRVINVKELAPGASGFMTFSFDRFIGNSRYIKSGDIAETTPSAELKYKDEQLKTKDKVLKIKQNTKFGSIQAMSGMLGNNLYDTWQEKWGNDLKPENSEDYWYIEYVTRVDIGDFLQSDYKLEMTDTLGDIEVYKNGSDRKIIKDETEIIAYGEKYGEGSPSFDDIKLKKNTGAKNSINITKTMTLPEGESKKPKSNGTTASVSVLVKVPAKKLGFIGESDKSFDVYFYNKFKAEVTPQDSTQGKKSSNTTGEVVYRYKRKEDYKAPENSFIDEKGPDYETTHSYGYDVDGPYVDREINWTLSSDHKVTRLTYDPTKGGPDDEAAYRQKYVKHEIIDEHVYLKDDMKTPLNEKDYSIKSIEDLGAAEFDYKLNKDSLRYDYEYANHNDKPIELFGKKKPSDEWTKLAEITEKGYRELDIKNAIEGIRIEKDERTSRDKIILGDGYSGIKIVFESKSDQVKLSANVNAVLHPTDRVKKAIDASAHDEYNMDMKIRNNATFKVHNDENKEIRNFETYKELELFSKKVPKMERKQNLQKMYNFFSNDTEEKQFTSTANVRYYEDVSYAEENKKDPVKFLHIQNSGTFYDLLPLGVTGIKDLKIEGRYLVDATTGKDELNSKYELIPNWRNSGRTMLIAKFDNARVPSKEEHSYPINRIEVELTYRTIYPWDSYKDFGPTLDRNLVAYESGFEKKSNDGLDKSLTNDLENGYKGSNPGYGTIKYSDDIKKIFTDQEIEWMKDLNPNNKEKRFLYSLDSITLSGEIEANIGLTNHVITDKNSRPALASTVKEGGNYQYNVRLQAARGTSVSNLVFFDSLENHKPSEKDENFGVKRWKGTLSSVDISNPLSKGIAPNIYVSTISDLDVEKHKDLSDSKVWTLYKEGDDLSKVKAIAVDLRKNKDGTSFKLKEGDSVNINLNMKAPWGLKEKGINPEDKAINSVYASSSITSSESGNEVSKLIKSSSTAVNIEPAKTKASIVADKVYLDKNGERIGLNGDEFTFRLENANGDILQTKTNRIGGVVAFDPIEYKSEDVGEHVYKIVEIKGNDNSIIYDEHEEIVKVKVEKNGDLPFEAKVIYDENGPLFKNKQSLTSLQIVRLAEGEKPFVAEEVKNNKGLVVSHKISDKDKAKTLDGAEYDIYKINSDGTETKVTSIKTENGISNLVENLLPGKYKLKETKAPKGYLAASKDLEFEITKEDAGKALVKFASGEDNGAGGKIMDMPSTGGQGTKALMIGGGALLIAMAGVFALANKKKKELNK